MANCIEVVKERKKQTFKKVDLDLGFFDQNGMRSPSSHFVGKRSYRGTFNSTLSDDTFWEKRGTRRHSEDYRGGAKGHRNEILKESSRNDTGRPPGEGKLNGGPPIVAPVILTREKSGSETSQIATKESKIVESSNSAVTPASVLRPYQIVSKTSALEGTVIPDQAMTYSLKLLDDSLHLGDDLSSFLLDQNHFLVLAVIGLQASGKSTIASFLADPSRVDNFKLGSYVFRPETTCEVLRGCHSTSGIDVFITKDRVIILDLQPLLSPSVMDFIVTQERKASVDYSSTENFLEIESLQLLTYAMSVAHVLVVVQDYILHPNLIRLLHTCQMMKPTQSSSSRSGGGGAFDGANGDFNSYFPHVVFVHNRCFPQHFTPKAVEKLQAVYQASLADSGLCCEGQIGIGTGTFSPPLSTASFSINLFLVPEFHLEENCPTTFANALWEMRRQILSLGRCPLTHVTLTEKTWYQYACRMWETIRKSSLYVEYNRLLP